MTQAEFKQAFAVMPPTQILANLRDMEVAFNTVWLPAEKEFKLRKDRDNAVTALPNDKLAAKVKTVLTIVSAALMVLFFILSGQNGNFLPFLFKLAAYFFLIFTVIAAFTLIPAWKSVADLEKKIPQLETDLIKASAELEEVQKQYNDLLVIREWICPEETNNPTNLRVFVKLFEDGRANSMKEAWNLFEEYMHRQRMEIAANAMVAASREAAIAAENARIAAQYAASDAKAARYAAEKTSLK